jgi:ribosomal protein S21
MSDIKRKKGESFEAYIRRVKQTWVRSGKILQARKVKFFMPKKSKNVMKNQAVSYSKKISKENYLRKTGKLPPEDPRARKGKRRR